MSEIRFEEAGSKGRYVIRAYAHEAELTFSRLSDFPVMADHTAGPGAL